MAAIRAENITLTLDWSYVPAQGESSDNMTLKEVLTLGEGLREVYGPSDTSLLL